MSKTPKTDSIHLDDEIESFETRYDWMYDHARELERENAELRKDLERLERERDEARKEAEYMREMMDPWAECDDASFPWEKSK